MGQTLSQTYVKRADLDLYAKRTEIPVFPDIPILPNIPFTVAGDGYSLLKGDGKTSVLTYSSLGLKVTGNVDATDFTIKDGTPLSTTLSTFATKIDSDAKYMTKIEAEGIKTQFFPITTDNGVGYKLFLNDTAKTTKLEYNNDGLKVTGFVDVTGGFKVNGQQYSPFSGTNDFVLGNDTKDTRGATGASRALVRETGAKLIVNYNNDFTGGVDIQGSGGIRLNGGAKEISLNTGLGGANLRVTGKDINLNTGTGGMVYADKICSTTGRCINLNHIGLANDGSDSGINFTNKNGGQLRFQDDANLVQYSKTNTANIAFNKLEGNFGN